MKTTEETGGRRIMKSFTFMIYCVLWEGLIFGGTGYAVFFLGHSGWWFLVALYISGSQIPASKWKEL